ncbi:aryl-sulfate sulfotransferase, partial [Candidatus Jorgensenbacteria bacterium]|nr:aryl-sulfate sulfotransferase [Candidatus Jorgensenbacteria bacterium]
MLLLVALIVIGVVIYSISSGCRTYSLRYGVFTLDRDRVSPGYTLLAPFTRFKNAPGGTVYLLDLLGKPVHIWQTAYQVMSAKLTRNSSLFIMGIDNPDSSLPGGKGGVIQELDWNGKVIWEYRNELMHHDFDVLPNGNVVLLIWEDTPLKIAQQLKGGVKDTEYKGRVLSDAVIEINRHGEIVWTWHFYEYLDPEKDFLGS